ncbi:hypothetical protein JCGZ_15797 [Jatropha curcas]|uniref:C2H2-type domain-containing protein n=1 Tax=Jatropha curcas TaxID=180498 RepID=A0A067LA57_JATCU|nr:uncharacterized protein LOC105630621 [Jatropha curcas]KDP41390.1 hypothetical protein JCGZ_15797 [Jatropha curcas]
MASASASASFDSSASNHHRNLNHLPTESLPLIDLNLLSQSELLSLSLCCSSSSSVHHYQNDTDVATPKIDRSIFNESAGSRKQTFSRLRLAHRNNPQFSPSPSIRTPGPYQTTEQVLDEEDSQIISLLKSLFGANLDNNDNDINLVSVPIQYNESLEFLDFPSTRNEPLQNVPITSFADYSGESEIKQSIGIANADSTTTKKRKRGRPRKNESNFYGNNNNNNNLNYPIENESKQIETKTIVVDDNLSMEMEKEKPKEKGEVVMMDSNGMAVDFVALAGVEDPFWEELSRRTMGMHTEDQLLGFLQGLEGEWVSNRRKKKIVNASLLGNVLPSGWKLMLCIKKKAGYFWIACRRYISPNGQQFMSCKEVSSYLLSLYGLQDANQSNFGHIDGNFQLTDRISSENAADVTLKVDKTGDDIACCLALPVTSKSVEHENQASSVNEGIPEQVQSVGKYKCHKCTMAFDEPDNLLQHLLSSHQRAPKRLRHAMAMNEEVIIKNGKYECQFCHKPFEERHRYNGHLGNHIKDYFKRIEASGGAMTIQRSTVPQSVGTYHDVLKIQESIRINMGSIAINSDIKTKDVISSAFLEGKEKENTTVKSCCDKQDMFYSMNNDKEDKVTEVNDVIAVEINVFPGAESASLYNENDSIPKPSGETNFFQCATDTINTFGAQEEGSLPAVGRDRTFAVDNNEDQVCTSLKEDHSQERGSDSCSLSLNSVEKEVDGTKDISVSSTINGMKIDEKVFLGKEKLRTGFSNDCLAKEDVANNIKEQRSCEGSLVIPSRIDQKNGPVDNAHLLSNSTVVENTHDRGSKGGLLSSLGEKTCVSNDKVNQVFTSTVNKSKFDKSVMSRNSAQKICLESNNMLAMEDPGILSELENISGSHSVVPSWKEQMCSFGNNASGTSICTRKKHCQENESEVIQLNLFGSENITMKVSNATMAVPNQNKVPLSKNSECCEDVDVVAGHATDIDLERTCNNLPVRSSNELTFASKDGGVLNGTSKNLMQDRISESSLHEPSCDGHAHDNENSMNKVSYIIMDQHKHKQFKSSCDVGPNIAFDNSHTEQHVDVVKSTTQESCSKDSSLVISGNQQKFDVEDNLTGLYTSTLNEQKSPAKNLLSLSKSEQVWSVENNSSRDLTGRVQEESALDYLNPREKESLMGFSTYAQNENALSGFMWRTDEQNDPLSSFADTSSQLVHSSSYFPTYDVMSDKGESELFGEKFNGTTGFDGVRSSGMENMEYNFMTSHSVGSKVFSYNAEITQGLDSSVWLEKEALPLLPKIASKRHTPALCVWCRNEFHYEALESEAQIGSMGFTCATCKAKFSGQFNLM